MALLPENDRLHLPGLGASLLRPSPRDSARELLLAHVGHPSARQCRYASIHSAPSGGGAGNGRSRMGSDWRLRPRIQMATICSLRFRSTRSTVTGTPSTVVSNGTARFSSIIVNQ